MNIARTSTLQTLIFVALAFAGINEVRAANTWYANAWNWTKTATVNTWRRTNNAIEKTTNDTIDWYNSDLITHGDLVAGKYSHLQNEGAIQDVIQRRVILLTKITQQGLKTEAEKSYIQKADARLFVKARELLAEGNHLAAVGQYHSWLEDVINNSVETPPLSFVNEALIAPSVLFVADYHHSRKVLQLPELPNKCSLVIPALRPGFNTPIEEYEFHSINYLAKILNQGSRLAKDTETAQRLKLGNHNHLGMLAILDHQLWHVQMIRHKQIEHRRFAQRFYAKFCSIILTSTSSHLGYAHEADNRRLLDGFQIFLDEKDESLTLLEKLLKSPLFSEPDKSRLKALKPDLRSLFQSCSHLVGLYRIDLPIRIRLLCVSIAIDQGIGSLNDNESKIMTAGVQMQHVASLLPHITDQQTAELFYDTWKRLKEELNENEFNDMKTRSKIQPDWLTDLNLQK